MKTVTKTFKKQRHHGWVDIEDIVTDQLIKPYYFYLAACRAFVRTSPDHIFGLCMVPKNLVWALDDGTAITFSITLPERYWK